MDINQEIELTGNKGKISLPMINLLRLTVVHLRKLVDEYGQTNDTTQIKKFFDWVLHEKMGVSRDGGKVLL